LRQRQTSAAVNDKALPVKSNSKKVSFKRKIIVYFPAVMITSLIVLILSYNSQHAVIGKLRFIERIEILFNNILEARR